MAVKCELGRMWYRGRSVEEAVFLTRSLQSEQASYIQTTDTPKGNVVWAGGLKEMVRTESVHESQEERARQEPSVGSSVGSRSCEVR